jgi:signal transduction histidine kinase
MKNGSRPTISVLVAATLVAVTTLVLATIGTISYVERRNEAWRELRRETAAEADELAVGLALAAWNIDRDQIDKVIEALGATTPIESITVTVAGRTHVFAREPEDWGWVPVRSVPPPTAAALVEERAILFAGETMGTVRVVESPRFVEADLRQWLMSFVGLILATDALLVLGVYVVLWLAVLRPLLALQRYAVAMSAEGRSGVPALGPARTAELESLRASIATMIHLLDLRYAELQEHMVRQLELQESLRESEKMSAMGSLVAGVAHEVRTPLFGMSATLDAYEDELRQGDLLECGAALRQQVNRLNQLMSDLLEFGKPATINPSPGSLRDLIDDVIASRSAAAREANIALRNLIDATDPRVPMDRNRLRQVFENLIDNAIQHSAAGHAVTVSAHETGQGNQLWVECDVEDEGGGFAAEDLAKVFEPFFTRRQGGTGLGLSIVRRIVEQHAGRVSATNRPGGGARMTVRLPRAEPA